MKNMLVTGGSGGIGEEIVKHFSLLGYNVILFYNSNTQKAEYLKSQYNAVIKKVDITSEQGVALALQDVKKQYGNISVVINCAGITKRGLMQDFTEQDFNDIFNVNVKGIFNVCKALIWDLVSTKGDIINLSSIWANYPASCEVLYSASKGAVESFTRSLAQELGYSGVKVNAISPGFVNTKMNSGISPQEIAEFLQENNLTRVIEPKEIALLAEQIIKGDKTGEIFEIFG